MFTIFQFVMRSGPTPGATFPLSKDQLTIGRDATNAVAINDAEISRKHSRLSFQGGKYVIEDLGSTNGTFVNGQRLTVPVALEPGDIVSLGEEIVLMYDAFNETEIFQKNTPVINNYHFLGNTIDGSAIGSNEKNLKNRKSGDKLNVFLSHSSQDKSVVRELYQKLLNEVWIDPWLDEEKLLPGQDWDMEIENAVEAADTVIVCISNKSVTKEGYIQRELKFVLDVALEKPEGTIFVIPLRFDDCKIPRRLRGWQYVDYFGSKKENGLKSIIKSLEIRLAQKNSQQQVGQQQALNLFQKLTNVIGGQEQVQTNKGGFHSNEENTRELTVKNINNDAVKYNQFNRLNEPSVKVFISYSRRDIEFVRMLAKDLDSLGMKSWWDVPELQGGDTWIRSIQNALDKCKYCAVILTPDSIQSPWVEREYTYAFNNKVKVIPIYLKTVEKIPFAFSTIHYIDFRDNRYEMAIRQLRNALSLK